MRGGVADRKLREAQRVSAGGGGCTITIVVIITLVRVRARAHAQPTKGCNCSNGRTAPTPVVVSNTQRHAHTRRPTTYSLSEAMMNETIPLAQNCGRAARGEVARVRAQGQWPRAPAEARFFFPGPTSCAPPRAPRAARLRLARPMGQTPSRGHSHIAMLRRGSAPVALEDADVPLAQLGERVDLLAQRTDSGPTGFDLEWALLEESAAPGLSGFQEARRSANVPLNRYNDVWPNDEYRVTIGNSSEDTDCECAFSFLFAFHHCWQDINASFVDSLWQRRAYIMAQGPLVSTVGDFWTMVWEQRMSVIVMVTQLREKDREKCAQYWPDDTGPDSAEDYGPANVVLVSEVLSSSSIMERVLELRYYGSPEVRTVHQVHLLEWVDHSVPKTFAPFCNLVRLAERLHQGDAAPMLVHCSAGIGRSGVFCAVHSIWKNVLSPSMASAMLGGEPCVNVLRVVRHLRRFRPGSVQTSVQYVFIYRAVAHLWNMMVAGGHGDQEPFSGE